MLFSSTQVITGLARPFGLNSDASHFLYVTDMDLHTVVRFAPDLSCRHYLDVNNQCWQSSLSDSQPRLHGPHSVDFDRNDFMYVTTYYTPGVHVYTREGRQFKQIGVDDTQYKLEGPASAFIFEGSLYVSEYAQSKIVCYTLDGKFVQAVSGFNRLHMLKHGPDGYLYCADTWNHVIKKLNKRLEVVHQWSVCDKINPFTPVSINFFNDKIISVDWANHTVDLFSLEGNLLEVITAGPLKHPYDAYIWQSKLVIADSHHSRLLLLGIEE